MPGEPWRPGAGAASRELTRRDWLAIMTAPLRYRPRIDATVEAIQWIGTNTAAIREFANADVIEVRTPNVVGGRGLFVGAAGQEATVIVPRDWLVRRAGSRSLLIWSSEQFDTEYELG